MKTATTILRKKDSSDIALVNNSKSKTDKSKTDIKTVKRMKSSFNNFSEFKALMQNLDNAVAMTMHENRILLVSRTLENHLQAIINFRLSTREYKNNKHIMNVSKLRNHIKWLRDRGFVFSENKKTKTINISNYVKA